MYIYVYLHNQENDTNDTDCAQCNIESCSNDFPRPNYFEKAFTFKLSKKHLAIKIVTYTWLFPNH